MPTELHSKTVSAFTDDVVSIILKLGSYIKAEGIAQGRRYLRETMVRAKASRLNSNTQVPPLPSSIKAHPTLVITLSGGLPTALVKLKSTPRAGV